MNLPRRLILNQKVQCLATTDPSYLADVFHLSHVFVYIILYYMYVYVRYAAAPLGVGARRAARIAGKQGHGHLYYFRTGKAPRSEVRILSGARINFGVGLRARKKVEKGNGNAM